jgi:kynurenine--oxoglutarate transaminase/cysteine-S-conjugate beta-lyase/glutamine--phenylpyruvate transaminase
MWERTISIGSGGKTFSVTGWKIGWAYGPAKLMHNLQVAHQNCVYTCATPVQEAIARAINFECSRLESPDCYFSSIAVELEQKKHLAVRIVADGGLKPIVPDGACFMLADWSALGTSLRCFLQCVLPVSSIVKMCLSDMVSMFCSAETPRAVKE